MTCSHGCAFGLHILHTQLVCPETGFTCGIFGPLTYQICSDHTRYGVRCTICVRRLRTWSVIFPFIYLSCTQNLNVFHISKWIDHRLGVIPVLHPFTWNVHYTSALVVGWWNNLPNNLRSNCNVLHCCDAPIAFMIKLHARIFFSLQNKTYTLDRSSP